MRIGIDVPRDGFAGGIERYAHDLAVDLRARGHQMVLLHGAPGGRDREAYRSAFDAVVPRERAGEAGLDVAYVQRAASVDELWAYGDLPLLVASHDHDHTCVRSHRYLPWQRDVTQACHRSPSMGCVARGCALVRNRGAGLPVTLRSPLRLRSRTQALARRARLVACSRYVADNLVASGVPRERVAVVHPVPVASPRPVTPRPAARELLFVGALLRGKGVEVAIDAVAALAKARLRIVGEGPSRAALARRAAPLGSRVSFEGACAPHEVDRFYDEASVVVVPSTWPEPFGMVGIEAMRRGRPVVGAAHGGIPEWLEEGQGGRLFTPGDAASLTRAAEALLGDAQAGERALAASRAHCRTGFVDQLEIMLRDAARVPRRLAQGPAFPRATGVGGSGAAKGMPSGRRDLHPPLSTLP